MTLFYFLNRHGHLSPIRTHATTPGWCHSFPAHWYFLSHRASARLEPSCATAHNPRDTWSAASFFTKTHLRLPSTPFPGGRVVKNSACQCRRCGFHPWVGKISWRKKWQPSPVFLLGKSHGQRSPGGYRPWGPKEWDTAEWTHTHTCNHTLQRVGSRENFKGGKFRGDWFGCSFKKLPNLTKT